MEQFINEFISQPWQVQAFLIGSVIFVVGFFSMLKKDKIILAGKG